MAGTQLQVCAWPATCARGDRASNARCTPLALGFCLPSHRFGWAMPGDRGMRTDAVTVEAETPNVLVSRNSHAHASMHMLLSQPAPHPTPLPRLARDESERHGTRTTRTCSSRAIATRPPQPSASLSRARRQQHANCRWHVVIARDKNVGTAHCSLSL